MPKSLPPLAWPRNTPESKMIQRALMGELEPQEDRALQKIGRKKQAKNATLLMELPELNTTLIEAYHNFNHTTRAAKDMACCIKTTQQQTKWATELWQAAEKKLASLEQQPQQQPPLSLPAPPNETLPAYSPKPSFSATIPSDGDPEHHRVATTEASTMTDLVQTIEAASPAENQPRPQTSHDHTEPPPVEATTDTSPKADRHQHSRPAMAPRPHFHRLSSWSNLPRQIQHHFLEPRWRQHR